MKGWHGWVGIAVVVAVVDLYTAKKGLETMSAAYARCPKWISVPATAITVAHLLGAIPRSVDPFERLGDLIGNPTILEQPQIH